LYLHENSCIISKRKKLIEVKILELIELRKELEEINKRITEFKTSLKIEDKTERVAEIENMMLEADFWNDSEAASLLVTESKSIKKELDEEKDAGKRALLVKKKIKIY